MRPFRTMLKALLASRLLVGAVSARAQGFNPDKSVQVSFQKGAVVATVPAGAHLKKSFMEVTLTSKPGLLKLGTLPPGDAKDELGDEVYHGSVKIPVTGEGLKGEVTLEVQYQPCTEGEGGTCFPPTTRTLKVKAADIPAAKAEVKEAAKSATPKAEAKAEAPAPQAAPAEAPKVTASPAPAPAPVPPVPKPDGLSWLLLGAFVAGLFASLTPCVYPMIPITMAIIGAKSQSVSRTGAAGTEKGGGKAKGFALSLSLVMGMAVTYTTLGVFAARSGAAFGAFAQKPIFLIPVSLLFAAFALSLFGAFEISLPQGLQNKLQGGGPRKGYLGAFVMGMVLGPLAAPCVGPVVGAILVCIAQQGSMALGALQLFVFSLGMGVLFLLVGTFSAGLPRSGDWLTTLKHVMGLIVLGFAAWNVRLVVPEWTNYLMWAVVTLTGAAVLGAFAAAEGLLAQLRKGAALTLLAFGVLPTLRATESFLRVDLLPREGKSARVEAEPAGWMEQDLEGVLSRAKAEGKLVLVDIYADWCAQCKELDEKTWPDPGVKAWIKQNAVPIRIDTDKRRPDLARKLEIRSYPTVLLLDGDGREQRRILGFQKREGMLKFLQGK